MNIITETSKNFIFKTQEHNTQFASTFFSISLQINNVKHIYSSSSEELLLMANKLLVITSVTINKLLFIVTEYLVHKIKLTVLRVH